MRREIRERQDVWMQLDPELIGHERATSLDPPPGLREAIGQLAAQRRIGEGDAVFDVRREVVGARWPG